MRRGSQENKITNKNKNPYRAALEMIEITMILAMIMITMITTIMMHIIVVMSLGGGEGSALLKCFLFKEGSPIPQMFLSQLTLSAHRLTH